MSASHVYRIRVRKYMGGSFFKDECYYEPRPLPAAHRARLENAGWSVTCGRVSVEREYRRLTGLSVSLAREDAALRGASSACHAYALGTAVASGLADDVLAAAEGRGSLLTED